MKRRSFLAGLAGLATLPLAAVLPKPAAAPPTVTTIELPWFDSKQAVVENPYVGLKIHPSPPLTYPFEEYADDWGRKMVFDPIGKPPGTELKHEYLFSLFDKEAILFTRQSRAFPSHDIEEDYLTSDDGDDSDW